jgi:hypothetical protein
LKKAKPKSRSGTQWSEEQHRERGKVQKKFRWQAPTIAALERYAAIKGQTETAALEALILAAEKRLKPDGPKTPRCNEPGCTRRLGHTADHHDGERYWE